MSDTGLTVPGMTEPPRRYDVTITVDQDGGHHPILALEVSDNIRAEAR